MSDEIPAKLRLKELVPGPERESLDVHDVKAILQANLKHEKSLKVNQPIPVIKKKSRRMRDYLICLILSNVLIALLVRIVGINLISVVFGFSGLILITAGLTWIMFQVMDDY